MPKLISSVSCPYCGCTSARVANTTHEKTYLNGTLITATYRRRVCMNCALPFGTLELPVENPSNGPQNGIDSKSDAQG